MMTTTHQPVAQAALMRLANGIPRNDSCVPSSSSFSSKRVTVCLLGAAVFFMLVWVLRLSLSCSRMDLERSWKTRGVFSRLPWNSQKTNFKVYSFNARSMAIVTMVSNLDEDMEALRTLVGSVQFWHPELRVLVYGYKTSAESREEISTWANVVLVTVEGELKSAEEAIKHALSHEELALFVDVHMVFNSRLDYLEEQLRKDGYFAATSAADAGKGGSKCRPQVFGFMRESHSEDWSAIPFDTTKEVVESSVRSPAADTAANRCSELKKEYKIAPMSSWGTATPDIQNEWRSLNCDEDLNLYTPQPEVKLKSVFTFSEAISISHPCVPLSRYPIVTDTADIRTGDRVTLSVGAGLTEQSVSFDQTHGRFEMQSSSAVAPMWSNFLVTFKPPPNSKLDQSAIIHRVLQYGDLVSLHLLKSSSLRVVDGRLSLDQSSGSPQVFLLSEPPGIPVDQRGVTMVQLQLWVSIDAQEKQYLRVESDQSLSISSTPTTFALQRAGAHYAKELRTISADLVMDKLVTSSSSGHTHQHSHAHDDESEDLASNEKATKIAILVPILSTKDGGRTRIPMQNFPFVTIFMPTFLKSIKSKRAQASSSEKFEYIVYLGYDVGDPYFDSEAGMSEFSTWFKKSVSGFPISLRPSKHSGMKGAPVWLWNALAEAAFHDGCHYFYQLNDDIRFVTAGWTEVFVQSLRKNAAHKDIGVTGPVDGGNRRIFTQSFVSRLHFEVFPTFYPKSFKNWWSDDWISRVYEPGHNFQTEQEVKNTNVQGTRYDVAWGGDAILNPEVEMGRRRLKEWLLQHNQEQPPATATAEAKHDHDHGAEGDEHAHTH